MLLIVVFAGLTVLKLMPVAGDQIVAFSGFFHLLRRITSADHEPFSAYLDAAWAAHGADSANPSLYHTYHVRFAWGFVYPLLTTLYAGFADGLRQVLPKDVNYLEILVRAGSSAMVGYWLGLVSVVAWAIFRFQDAAVRAKVAVAAICAVVFDYVVDNNFPVFNGHRLARYVHDGQLYAMTISTGRGAVSVLYGLYVAARALEVRGGRRWLIPMAFIFHLPLATTLSLVLLAAEAVLCAVRRQRTPDLLVLAVCSVAGLLATATMSFTGYPDSTAGVLPGGQVLKVVVWHAIAHPVPKEFLVLAIGGLCLVGGVWCARVPGRSGLATALVVFAAMSGLGLIQFATGQAIVDHLLTWHDNPSVHSLLYLFDYASSTALLGVSLWLLVRGGEWVARRLAGRLNPHQAVALIATVVYVTVSTVMVTTSRTRGVPLQLWPRGPVGEVFIQIWKPERWYQTAYPSLVRRYDQSAVADPVLPHLAFSDRRFLLGKDWIFTVLVYLRNLHQWAVWGPIPGRPEIVPYSPRQAAQDSTAPTG